MEIIQVKIQDLKPSEYNPRGLTEKEMTDLKESILSFGMVEPIIVNGAENRKNIIIGGHQRFYICRDLGWQEIPVVYINISEIEKEQELNLRLNKNLGHWDWDLLAGHFGKETLIDIGFSSEELDRNFLLEMTEDNFDAESEYQKIQEPQTKYGELFKLGNHRLLCGDATKKEDAEKLMNGKLGDMIFTDPPYNVDYKSPGGLDYASKKFGGTGGKIFNDDKSDEECIKFYSDVLINLYKSTKDSCTIYWWFANKNNWINRLAFKNSNWHFSQVIIWLKNSMVFSRGQDYHRVYEPCMVGWKEKKKHFTNKLFTNLQDVFNLEKAEFEEMLDVWYIHRDVTIQYQHPTQRPIKLAERALKKNSKINDIILDFFGGSGSTLLACEQLNRRCYMMELDPKYCDVIIKRWEQFTNQKAEKLN